jgi:molybdate transport system ATP-binding protein
MHPKENWDILLSNKVHKKGLIDSLLTRKATGKLAVFNSLKGLLFSDMAIEKFIEREDQYDIVEAATEKNRKLRSFSSGERKKEFLNYCLSQKPDYIIFDNPLDHLDQKSRKILADSIEKLKESIHVIQLVNRTADLLPFLSNKAQINDNSFALHPIDFSKKINVTIESSRIPKPANTIEYTDTVLVRMKDITVTYNERPIVNAVNWTIKKSEFWQLIGPNGSGKSTLLSMITGENPKGYGQDLWLFGIQKGSGESIWDIKKNIGYFSTAMTDLFQKNHSLENMILSGFFDSIGLYIKPTTLQKKIVNDWLDLINMSHLRNTMFYKLSIGQQRVALIIRAVLKHPPLVILDEPVEGLDDENVQLVTQLINLLTQKTDMTLLFVSHRIEPSLAPNLVYELIPSENGSIGVIKK